MRYGFYEPKQTAYRRLDAGRFEKDVIRTGMWVLKDGRKLDVTEERMDGWIEKFAQMKAAGIQIDFPVDHSDDSRDNMGFVEALQRRGDTLFCVADVPKPEDESRMGTTIREVSISVDPHFRDGSGKDWGEAICHIAPCTRPVVHGQSNFVPLAARQRAGAALSQTGKVEIYFLKKDGNAMDLKKEVAALLKLSEAESETDELVLAALKARNEQHTTNLRQAKDQRDQGVTRIATLDAEVKELRAKLPAEKPADNPEIMAMRKRMDKMVRDGAASRVAQFRAEGKVTPAMEEAARELLSAREMNLRVKDADVDVASAVETLFAALPKGAALDLSERTRQFTEIPKEEELDEVKLRKQGENVAARVQGRKVE